MKYLTTILIMACIPLSYADEFSCIATETFGDQKGTVSQYLLTQDGDNYTLNHLWAGIDIKFTAIDSRKHLHLENSYRNDSLDALTINHIVFRKFERELRGLQTITTTSNPDSPLSVYLSEFQCYLISDLIK